VFLFLIIFYEFNIIKDGKIYIEVDRVGKKKWKAILFLLEQCIGFN